MSEESLKNMRVIPAGRSIVKLGDRYAIYLPISLNNAWKYLHNRKTKVSVYIIIDDKE